MRQARYSAAMNQSLLVALLTLSSGASAATLPIEQVISGHTGWATGAALSPDGRQLALISRSAVYLTELGSGKQTALAGHLGIVTGAAYPPDGKILFTSGSDGTVRRWDTASGKRLSTLQACGLSRDAANAHEWATSLAVRSASDLTVSCAGQVQVWRGGQRVRTLPGDLAAYSPDGTRLAVSNGEHPLKLYDARTFEVKAELALPRLAQPIDVFTTPGPPSALAFSPDGARLAVAFSDSMPKVENFRAAVYSTASGQLLFELGGFPDLVQGLAYSPDGKTLAATGRSSTKLYDAGTGKQLKLLQPPNTRIGVNAVAWTPDGRQVIATSTQKGAEVLTLSGRVSRTYTAPADMVPALAWNPAETLLATGGTDGQLQFWKGAVPVSRWQAHQGGATGLLGANDLTFSPDGTRLVSGGQDGTLRFWTPTGKRLTSIGLKTNTVGWPQLSRNGQALLFGDGTSLFLGNTARLLGKADWPIQPVEEALYQARGEAGFLDPLLWQKQTGGAFWQFKGTGGSTFAVRLLPDARTMRELSAASHGTALSQYDAVTGKMIRTVLPASRFGNGNTGAFSADGQRFAFGKTDGTTELWGVDSTLQVQRLASFPGEGQIYRTVISPDGRFIAARRGESVSVFDVRRKVEVGTYRGLSASSYALAFNLAGTRLAVGSGTAERGGTVTVFRVQ